MINLIQCVHHSIQSGARMCKMEKYYTEAIEKCKDLTATVVKNTTTIMGCVETLNKAILQAHDPMVVASINLGGHVNLPPPTSLPAFMQKKELPHLTSAADALKIAVKRRLSSTLQDLNAILHDGTATGPLMRGAAAEEAYQKYREELIKCIDTLNLLDFNLCTGPAT